MTAGKEKEPNKVEVQDEIGAIEDLRNATSIHAGISGQLFAASLVLMGVIIVYFDVKKVELNSKLGVVLIAAIVFLLSSTIIAGFGLKKIRDKGIKGVWEIPHGYFRFQTLLNYFAILFFFVIFFETRSTKSDEEIQLERTNNILLKTFIRDSLRSEDDKKYNKEIEDLKENILLLEKQQGEYKKPSQVGKV